MDNLIYIWIPKNGGTSFVKSMMKKHPNFKKDLNARSKFSFGTYGHCDIKQIFQKDELLNLKKICVCRNPYDRFVSLYHYSLKRGFVNKNIDFYNFAKKVCIDKIEDIGRYNKKGLSYCNPQHFWISEIEDVKVYRMEKIDRLFHDFNIKNIKVNATKHKPYMYYYKDKAIVKMINNFYNYDFEKFGYKKI